MRIAVSRRLCGGLFAFTLSVFAFTQCMQAQRLPKTVRPEHYTLTLSPDLQAATFTGDESVDVVLAEPLNAITLNAAEINFRSVTTTVAGKSLTAKVSEDATKQQATFDFGQQLPAGPLKLHIRYTGLLNNELRGFYLSKTAKRNYAVTQFESTDARRAFPSFDEPAMKATFSVTLVVDKGDTAISNTNIVSDKPVANEAGKHAITFATTPKMSTYLLAFLVGDFQCVAGESDGVPIRACATPDQVQYGKFALSAAEYVLHYYNDYFGIKYPMPKLDMIAIPDFEAGAMENFGAITYRESDFLVDPEHASVGALRRVGIVVAHEMAHQWFGDMVTLAWWDNTWLNEGFANWMEAKPIDAWKPEWNMTAEIANDLQGTLDLDAQRTTRTIRAKAETPDEINEMFDGISYGKAGGMLDMVENYLGKETFRQGVHKYLLAHMYGNATAEDFWNTEAEVSHKPVDKIMDSLVSQPGVPLLTFGAASGSSVPVRQSRFFLDPTVKTSTAQAWTLPVCFKAGENEHCEVLTPSESSLKTPSNGLLYADATGRGYFRSLYSTEAQHDLVAKMEASLTPEERIAVLGDQWAAVHAGRAPIASYLEAVSAVHDDASAEVIERAAGALDTIDTQIAATPEERTKFSAWVRGQFAPAWKALGAPQADDSAGKRELRAALLGIAAGLGDDPEAIAEAKSIATRSLADPGSVDPTLANTALFAAARNGDSALFDQLVKLSTDSESAQVRANALRALERFRDPDLERRALDFAVSGKVRNQDAAGFISVELVRRDTQDLAWQYIQDNWSKVSAQFTTFAGAELVGAAGGFCSAQRSDEVTKFFATHKVAASARALARAKDHIQDCMTLRQTQQANFQSWLSSLN
ncbi:M1 family metallopeptidase [Acidicapsa dinghuensis]|uniref:Aminopeptidase n=1 Tax=Acidicapsa dinghuensis TaxID=2218256 RepID=A0ABW1EF95_9BACT|nr:M1 family metallopeptidase [Acidicapsa dinghuensis]